MLLNGMFGSCMQVRPMISSQLMLLWLVDWCIGGFRLIEFDVWKIWGFLLLVPTYKIIQCVGATRKHLIKKCLASGSRSSDLPVWRVVTSPFPFFFISMQTSQNHKSQTLLCVNQCIYVCTNKSSHMFPFLFRSLCAPFFKGSIPFPFFSMQASQNHKSQLCLRGARCVSQLNPLHWN